MGCAASPQLPGALHALLSRSRWYGINPSSREIASDCLAGQPRRDPLTCSPMTLFVPMPRAECFAEPMKEDAALLGFVGQTRGQRQSRYADLLRKTREPTIGIQEVGD